MMDHIEKVLEPVLVSDVLLSDEEVGSSLTSVVMGDTGARPKIAIKKASEKFPNSLTDFSPVFH